MILKFSDAGVCDVKSSLVNEVDPSSIVCSEKNGVYYLYIRGHKILCANIQPEKFDALIVPQVSYSDDGCIIRLVTMDRKVIKAPFNINIHLNDPLHYMSVQTHKLSEVVKDVKILM